MFTTLDRIQYGFDRDSRRTWRRRELTTGEDDAYRYDGLSQVVQDTRGNLNLNQTAISAVPVSQESWDYDPTGNWRGYETQADGSVTLAQHRVYDKGNRLTQIEGDPSPILLDRAGRMRQLPPDASGDWEQSLELKWDAWGRITQVKRTSNEEVLGSYAYDGLTRRITREVDSVVLHSYYSNTWRPLEERKDAETDASMQYLWGTRHRDDLVRRDRDSDDDGDLDETRYVLMDYYSPASITDETGEVTERYAFSAFGIRRIMAPDWSPRSSSECIFEFAFQGQFLDMESGLLNYGYRYYSPNLGRWTCKDPVEEPSFAAWNSGVEAVTSVDLDDADSGERSLYDFTENRPTIEVDMFGLFLGFGYGEYCGWSRRHHPAEGVSPTDDIDRACQEHDSCLATWGDVCGFPPKFCNIRFCRAVRQAECGGDKKCKKGRRSILAGCALIVPIPPFLWM